MRGLPALSIVAALLAVTLALPSDSVKTDDSKIVFRESTAGDDGQNIYESSAKCQEFCTNRYGEKICCDDVPMNNGLACPPAPRIEVYCDDPNLFRGEVIVKECFSDKDCGEKERCCTDSCDPKITICMPGDRNTFYLYP